MNNQVLSYNQKMQVTKDNTEEVMKLLRHGPECIVRPHLHEPISKSLRAYRYDNVPTYSNDFTRFALVRECSSCLQVLLDGNANVNREFVIKSQMRDEMVNNSSKAPIRVTRCMTMCKDYLLLSSILPLLVGIMKRNIGITSHPLYTRDVLRSVLALTVVQ